MENPLKANEILHSGEGRDVERWLESRNNSFVFAIACVSSLLLFIIHTCVIILLAFYNCFLSITFIIGLYSSQQGGN